MLTVTLWLATQAPALAKSGVPPVAGPVVRGFDPPDQPWLSGHRGIDMLAPVGTTVVAAMAGRVSFVGVIAGQPVIVVNHGDTRTTYLPVEASVGVGDQVAAGEELGSLAEGHSCTGGTCLHLGWLRGSTYLDPSQLFDLGAIRLLPSSAVAVAARLAAQRAALASEGSPGLLAHPANGRIGSGFGMRLHPIFHVWRMHSGGDIGARPKRSRKRSRKPNRKRRGPSLSRSRLALPRAARAPLTQATCNEADAWSSTGGWCKASRRSRAPSISSPASGRI
jgi:murein DD-endopeptidase MepM/ murein hydrolase activator NlpD